MKRSKRTDKKLKYRVKVTKNGPYVVSGGVPLTAQIIVLDTEGQCLEWSESKRYPDQENYSLCRCGQSKTRPFCDGTHSQISFEGTETASRQAYLEQSEKYTGPTMDLTDNRTLCVHAGFCDRAGGTWNLVAHSDDLKSRNIAIEETGNCPSGRLVAWDKAGQEIEPALEPSIGIMELPNGEFNGPIWVRGRIPIESAKGELYEIRNRVTLCGCGKSSNKPFCDGSHRD